MRTTSSVESMNSVMQRTFQKRPNIFNYVANLKLFESTQSTIMYQLHTNVILNEELKRKRAEDQKREEKIRYFTEKLRNNEISVYKFLMQMADNKFPGITTNYGHDNKIS